MYKVKGPFLNTLIAVSERDERQLLGWRSVLEKRRSLYLNLVFHVDTVRIVYNVSILNICFDLIEKLFIATEYFTGPGFEF